MHPQTKPSAIPSSNSISFFLSLSFPLQFSQTGRLTKMFLEEILGLSSFSQTKHFEKIVSTAIYFDVKIGESIRFITT